MQLIYTTIATKQEAIKLSEQIINERLAACANMIENMTSIYMWQDKLHHDSEITILFKTSDALVDKAISRIKQLHIYDCPSIFAIEIKKADKDYVKWLETYVNLDYTH